ncbi:MAG: hypothetical protein JSS93_10495 [Bacteroidetes bacterium]|nr:hypothetical protein [Bacteroidota bacterium]
MKKQYHLPPLCQTYVDTGDGEPVIILHGLFGNISMWKKTVEVLKKTIV